MVSKNLNSFYPPSTPVTASYLFRFFFIYFCFYSASAASQVGSLDGVFEEPHWKNSTLIENFLTTSPYSLTPPENATRTEIVSTELGVYIGFINYQDLSDSTVRTTLRDEDFNGDYNEVIIDFDGTGVRAFGFKIGRAGAIQDSVWINENIEDVDWDGNWQHGINIGDGFWSSEIFIPWSAIAMDNRRQRELRFYLSRWHQAKGMRYSYPSTDRNKKSFLSAFEKLLVETPKVNQFDIFPYASITHDTVEDTVKGKTGVDLFWKPSNASGSQINVALNPDFGQVETNELVVNFSALETFFTEKRPFFTENHELLELSGPESLRIVHTPRIGAETDTGDEEATDILAAARYTHVGDTINGSVLIAMEDDTKFSNGRHYLATRLQYNGKNYAVGIMQTYVDRPSLDRKAGVSVLDFETDVSEKIRLSGSWFYTDIQDATNNNTSDVGWWVNTEYEPDDKWSHELTAFHYGKDVQLDDFGFVRRVNRDQVEYEVTHEWSSLDLLYFRNAELGFGIEYGTNEQNQSLPMQLGIQLQASTITASTWGFEIEYLTDGIDDLITRGGNPVKFPNAYAIAVEYESQFTSNFQLETQINIGNAGLNKPFYEFELVPNYQFGENLNIGFGIAYANSDSSLIWIDNNVLGDYQESEVSYEFNLSWKLWERHEVRLKAESVVVTTDINTSYQANINGDLIETPNNTEDLLINEFAFQLRYRYEIGPLSEIYVVYGRGGEVEKNISDDSLIRKLRNPISSKDSEKFLVKVKLHF